MRTALLTVAALTAFAANSLLCRAALRGGAIDPATFSTIRLASGALMLVLLLSANPTGTRWRLNLASAAALFGYMLPFSFAYVHLEVGTGALLLFGAVQLTMIGAGLLRGERPPPVEWAGLAAASAGFVWLVLPGVGAPPVMGAALMISAGVAWGIYSLRGKGSKAPLQDTASNFVFAFIPAAVVNLAFISGLSGLSDLHISGRGIVLAVISGAVASSAGYAIWYAALRGLSGMQAAMVQLVVPLIASGAGVALMGESVTWRLAASSVLILGGIGLAVRARMRG